MKKCWGSIHIFQTCHYALFVFEGTFWDCRVLIDYCCCKTLNWFNSRFMFQSFKCILCAFLYILSGWPQTAVLYLKQQHFTLIKFQVCVSKYQVYFMVICPSRLTGNKMKSLVAMLCDWNRGVVRQRWKVRKYEKMYQKGLVENFFSPSPPPLPLINN